MATSRKDADPATAGTDPQDVGHSADAAESPTSTEKAPPADAAPAAPVETVTGSPAGQGGTDSADPPAGTGEEVGGGGVPVTFHGAATAGVQGVGLWDPEETKRVPAAVAARLCRSPLFTRAVD